MSLLQVDGISKSYEAESVLSDVSFEMDQQDVEVVVGPSGSGKSTLLQCVNRLTDIDGGTVRLDGQDIDGIEENRLRRRVGMVFQGFNLFTHRTARGNITLGLTEVLGMSETEAQTRAEEYLERVGLGDQADSYPGELSGGQKQRVGISRALAMDPEVILFDEPTSALDPELIDDVLAVMRDLASEGMTMLCVTHEMEFARSAATTLTFLDDGTIVERGPPEQLFDDPAEDRTREFLSGIANSHR